MANQLFNPYKFSNTKTVKLLDTYEVIIKLSSKDYDCIKPLLGQNNEWVEPAGNWYYIRMPQCTNVTLPELSLKTDEYKYGNNSKLMIYPDYDAPGDLKLEFMETIGGQNTYNDNKPVQIIQLFVNLFLSKLFDGITFTYKIFDMIPELIIYVYSNNFQTQVYEYVFKELQLTNYSKYTLDYTNSDLCKWSLEFAYRSYEQNNLSNITTNVYQSRIENDSKTIESDVNSNDEPISEEGSNVSSLTVDDSTSTPTAVPAGSSGNTTPLDQNSNNDVTIELDDAKITTGTGAIDGVKEPTATQDNAVKASDLLTTESRSIELVERVHHGKLGDKNGWIADAKKAGYTEEEIAYARSIFNSNEEYIANRKAYIAEQKAKAAEAEAANAKLNADVQSDYAKGLSATAEADKKRASDIANEKMPSGLQGQQAMSWGQSHNQKASDAQRAANKSAQEAAAAQSQSNAATAYSDEASAKAKAAREEADKAKAKAKATKDPLIIPPRTNDINNGVYSDVTTPTQPEKIEMEIKGDTKTPSIDKPSVTLEDVKPHGGLRSQDELKADSDKKANALKTNPLDDISFDLGLANLEETPKQTKQPTQNLPYASEAEYQQAKKSYESGKQAAWSMGLDEGLRSYVDKNPIDKKNEQLWYEKNSQAWDRAGTQQAKKREQEFEVKNATTKQKLDLYESQTR